MRPSGRAQDQLRPIEIIRHYTKHAEGSVLISYGDTKVICNASVIDNVPRFLKGKNQGWLTAEYGMLPRATHERTDREATRGKQTGRTTEIQRLIGRSLRSVVNLKKLPEITIHCDCDVIQADGGTRTAAITGSCIALVDTLNHIERKYNLPQSPLKHLVASTSVGIYRGQAVLDLEYLEDSEAETDMNVIMTGSGEFVELQGTGEESTFSYTQLQTLLSLGEKGVKELVQIQQEVLGEIAEMMK